MVSHLSHLESSESDPVPAEPSLAAGAPGCLPVPGPLHVHFAKQPSRAGLYIQEDGSDSDISLGYQVQAAVGTQPPPGEFQLDNYQGPRFTSSVHLKF